MLSRQWQTCLSVSTFTSGVAALFISFGLLAHVTCDSKTVGTIQRSLFSTNSELCWYDVSYTWRSHHYSSWVMDSCPADRLLNNTSGDELEICFMEDSPEIADTLPRRSYVSRKTTYVSLWIAISLMTIHIVLHVLFIVFECSNAEVRSRLPQRISTGFLSTCFRNQEPV